MKEEAKKERVVEIAMKSGNTYRFDASWFVIDKCRILNVYSYRKRGIRVFSALPDTWEYVYHVEAVADGDGGEG